MWVFLLFVCQYFLVVNSCNGAICGSIISKCMLTKSCNCDFKAQSCSKECFNCLGYLYTDCCSCLGMCPHTSDVLELLNRKSVVEDFIDPIPALFQALTESSDERNQWTSETFPVNISISKGPHEILTLNVNCTVAFLSQCVTRSKCKNTCVSMGSSSYRWFHNGCCECVGSRCINYGLNESKCHHCPSNEAGEEGLDENDLDYDYEEDMDETQRD